MKRYLYYILLTQLLNYLPAIFLVSSYTLYSQWSTDPYNNLIVGYGLLPELCSDSAGGCYITYEQNLSYPRQLILERLNRYGYKPWGGNKRITGLLEEQSNAKITEDGQNGIIICFQDVEIDYAHDPPLTTRRLRAQRVDSSGNFLWGSTGVRVSLSETNQRNQAIVFDGKGGCVIAWMDTMKALRSQQIDEVGNRVWGTSGILIVSNTQYEPILEKTEKLHFVVAYGRIVERISREGQLLWRDSVGFRINRMSADGNNGVIIAGKSGSIDNIQVVAQKIDSLGLLRWSEPFVVVSDSAEANNAGIPLCSLPNSSTELFWTKNVSGFSRLFAQRISASGVPLWLNKGILVSNVVSNQLIPSISFSSNGKIIIIWNDDRNGESNYCQQLDTLGYQSWDSLDVAVSIPAMSYTKMTTDGMGGCIIVGFYQSDFSIRTQQLSRNGKLGEIITSVADKKKGYSPNTFILYDCFPNPFNVNTTLTYYLPHKMWVSICLFDVLGAKVMILFNGNQIEGKHKINFNAETLSSGIYIVRMIGEQSPPKTKKILLIK